METKTYIKRLEKTYKCELKDYHSETNSYGVSTTQYGGIEGKIVSITEKDDELINCTFFDLQTYEYSEIYQR